MKPFFEWKPEYDVGVTIIDEQHKRLVVLINELYDATCRGEGRAVAGEVLLGVVSYTQTHFETEERLMRQYSYPDYTEHKKIHDELIRQAQELKAKHAARSLTVGIDAMNFLQGWLRHHISAVDKRLGAFLIERGEK